MPIRFCLPLLALGLTACGTEAEEPKSAEQVAAAIGELQKPEPGLYRTVTEVVDVSISGIPEAQQALAEQQAKRTDTSERCLTQEEADSGFQDMVRGLGQADESSQCEFSKFDVSGSDLDANMKCSGPLGSGAEVAMNGTVQSDKTDIAMDMKISGGPMGEMSMKMNIKSERVGDCP
ncbi:DUF3617 domain-containing protein [Pontixanthobacter aestiaquae]|uniref:DUF3617 family protein n=1 Tax=Pontixanthobacter aestiaquae TaxID=1509367 RepID=A0A844Z690_9SPHN|nr:DUF3617 domain-containing protein [Pontixanthobacter aestiaquae]MDN3644836.1 DUF3617 domain-containing protein [Pontixanthobacter aestiaquae]MXO84161.1 DUF3617 family protein [Pontixanthobacter aestiaquae]